VEIGNYAPAADADSASGRAFTCGVAGLCFWSSMEFYFRKNGATLGPLPIFRVRAMIEDGQILPEDIAWHEGMEAWQPVDKIPALQLLLPNAVSQADETSEPDDEDDSNDDAKTKLERDFSTRNQRAVDPDLLQDRLRKARAWQRFLARWIDLTLFTLLTLQVGVWLGLLEPGEVATPRFLAFILPAFLWVPLEAWFLSRYGATPGKALLGLRLTARDGEAISYTVALRRSVDVWFFGCGMELQLLNLLLKMLAFARYRQAGETSWDATHQLIVEHRPVASSGIIFAILLMTSALVYRSYVYFNAPAPSHLSTEERKLWEMMHPSPPQPSEPNAAPIVPTI
jgi:uncharacterized RDD family membrane protein YckC